MSRPTLEQCVSLACLLEATAPKPGNVHRGADFEDLTFLDLTASGIAIAPILAEAERAGVGTTILHAVRATRRIVPSNANLGIVLLLTPLAAVPCDQDLRAGVARVLSGLDSDDAEQTWTAIREAKPSGMGTSARDDLADPPPQSLLEAMRFAADRDRIAYQYAHDFTDVFDRVVPWILAGKLRGWTLTQAIVHTHVRLMAELPDSLIARKCGSDVAKESAAYAAQVLSAGSPGDENYHAALADLDFWLRSDGRRRNPGTTADLIAAGLFVLLREGRIEPPYN